MAFPTAVPTQRNYDPGDWPTKTFSAQSGREIRIRYGDTRTNARLELSYSNVADSVAEEFLTHFLEVNGTFSTFTLPDEARAGWSGTSAMFTPGGDTAEYRYEKPPQISSVQPGISSISVSLVGVV